jgi:hypothetical protein
MTDYTDVSLSRAVSNEATNRVQRSDRDLKTRQSRAVVRTVRGRVSHAVLSGWDSFQTEEEIQKALRTAVLRFADGPRQFGDARLRSFYASLPEHPELEEQFVLLVEVACVLERHRLDPPAKTGDKKSGESAVTAEFRAHLRYCTPAVREEVLDILASGAFKVERSMDSSVPRDVQRIEELVRAIIMALPGGELD